jgi:hypothetical protein
MERQQTEVQLAILDTKFDSLENVIGRMENSIQKITAVNERMGELLAVHAEKLNKQDKVDDIIFEKFDGFRSECKVEFNAIKDGCKRDILLVNERLRQIEKRVFMATGAVVLLSFFIRPAITGAFQGLFSGAKSATIERVVDLSYESGNGRIHQPLIAKTR